MKFHERLKAYRSNLNIPQKEVAKRLSVDPSVISRYEDGKRNIVADRLAEIQRAYNIPDEHFFDMVIHPDNKQARLQPEQAKELQSQYNDAVYFSHPELLHSERFRYLFVALASLPDDVRDEVMKKMAKEIDALKPAIQPKDHD